MKRIIGLPGDRINFVGGRVFVNGDPIETRPPARLFEDDSGNASA